MTRASEGTTSTPRAAHELVVDDGQSAAIDIDTIRRTCEAVLWAPRLSGDERDVAALLLGHVNLLLPEVDDLVSRTRGEQQQTAVHVISCTRRTLRAAGGVAQADASSLWDLATHCRALLTLYQQLSADGGRL
ncbi:DUF6415 family natural product biosynthesis protein [Streptomyces sp. NPDC002078]